MQVLHKRRMQNTNEGRTVSSLLLYLAKQDGTRTTVMVLATETSSLQMCAAAACICKSEEHLPETSVTVVFRSRTLQTQLRMAHMQHCGLENTRRQNCAKLPSATSLEIAAPPLTFNTLSSQAELGKVYGIHN